MYNQCSETYVKVSLHIIPACLPKTQNQMQSKLGKKTCTRSGLASQRQNSDKAFFDTRNLIQNPNFYALYIKQAKSTLFNIPSYLPWNKRKHTTHSIVQSKV